MTLPLNRRDDYTPGLPAVGTLDYRTPQRGEPVTHDGRLFILTAVEHDRLRAGWWKAIALDGRTTLQGNAKLKRCGLSNGWVTT